MSQLVRISVLIKELKKIQRLFRQEYRNAVAEKDRNETQQFLYDNYYIIDNTVKMLLSQDRKISVGINTPTETELGKLVYDAYPDSEKICEVIENAAKHREIKNSECNLIEWCFMYNVIFLIRENDEPSKLTAMLNSCRFLSGESIAEKINPIGIILSADTVYEESDCRTRRIYRDMTAHIAFKLGLSEKSVADKFISEAEKAKKNHLPENRQNVMWHIRKEFHKLSSKPSEKNYIAVLSLVPAVLALSAAYIFNNIFIALMLYLPIWEICKIYIDIAVMKNKRPEYLPRIRHEKGIPDDYPAAAVLSSIISEPKDITILKKKLSELYFLNMSKNLKICILCDYAPSELPTMPNDAALRERFESMLHEINKTYEGKFCGIIRKRSYSETESKFIGEERKRGAIEQLVKYIENGNSDGAEIFGDKEYLRKCRAVIALDFDTKPLLDTIIELVQIAVHPMNRPYINNGIVESGFGIIVPRITTKSSSAIKSPFSRLFGGMGSSCAYDTIASDLYQNCFGSGTFSGKGLIDTKAFFRVCADKLPKERILSHDIIEGELMRTAFAGDVTFSEGYPQNTSGWFRRQHRWIRGDIQNLPFIFKSTQLQNNYPKNKLSSLSRFKLFDNVRRAITPIIVFHLFFAGFFLERDAALLCAVIGVAAVVLPYLTGFIQNIFSDGTGSLTRSFFSLAVSDAATLMSQAVFALMMLPQNAVICADAVARGIWRRFVSHKKLLEWTTSAQSEKLSGTAFPALPAELLSILILLSPLPSVKLIGAFFVISPIALYFCGKPYGEIKKKISEEKRAELFGDVAAMWKYYADYAVEADNYLPPDNVQFSPVFRIAHRTSPTNIGMYLLSILTAADFEIISTKELYFRTDKVISAIEKMKKYCGNLYNWYETETLELSPNNFVSSVDSGNLLCCLVALKEGLKEYAASNAEFNTTISRIEQIIDKSDISVFFDDNYELFSVGINPETNELAPNHYDMLMSEARMLSYFAVARRCVQKKHWFRLARTMKKCGKYYGSAAYTGTMFEYFMPELLLKSGYGSLTYENLKFCVHCQNVRAKKVGLPFGISESGFYSFDGQLNYQYKAHGVQYSGIKRGLDKEYVVSPYSTYLAMQMDFQKAYDNLQLLKKLVEHGAYGQYEAIDFTGGRGNGAVVKSYMAHHVGMSIAAVNNTLNNGIMQKRFMRDSYMKSASELLEERIINNTVVYDDIDENYANKSDEKHTEEFFDRFSAVTPHIKLLTNGEYTGIYADVGASVLMFRGKDVILRNSDLLRRRNGMQFAVIQNNSIIPMTYNPLYDNVEQSAEFCDYTVNYYANYENLECGMKIGIHGSLPCELREFAIKNTAFSDTKASLICYIEPTMISSADFEAHPAFMRLFMNIRYDVRHRLIIAERNLRNGEKVYSATGFVNPVDSILCFDREKVLVYPEASVFDNAMKIKECHTSVPDGCIFIRTDLLFYPREQKNLKLFICSASTEEELYNTAAKIRNNALPGSISGFLPASAEVRLAEKILPQILYDNADTAEQTSAKKKNLLKINELWNYDVSGDYPIVTAEIKTHLADARISSYSGCHELLKRSGIEFDLVFIFSENSTKTKLIQDYIIHEIRSASASDSIGMRGGIHLVNLFERDEMIRTLVFASASHTAPTDMVFMEKPYSKYSPMKISPVGHKQSLSASFLFKEKSVVIDKMPKLPWCHILANETFGTLISSASLGYTYAVNSRENKLTPWFNDSRTDNSGEMLIIKYKEKCYNLIAESQVEFSADNAVYSGQCDDFSSRVSVSVADKGMCKKISVEIDWHGGNDICKIAYYTEPLLSSDNTHARYVTAEKSGNYLTFSNSRNYSVKGYMALSCDKPFSSMTNRADFLSGRWNQLSSGGKPCGAIIVGRSVSFGKKIKLNFYMSFGATEQAAKSIIKRYIPQKNFSENKISINTPDKNINNMFNTWLTQQIIKGRIFAKTGFYQNSGATGFRDQLQDACAAVLIRPEILRYQILRACRVQFPEGDVLHWWHRLPENNFRGVRTRCSDDLLWLPYALCEYTEKTNDLSLLTINVHYCSADALSDDEQEKYMNVSESELNESVSEHCRRALEKAFGFGNNGLCLIGLCDWNDGYNKLGEKGIGESVWLSEFLCVVLDKYSTLCRKNGDIKQADMYDEKRKELTENIEKACWDGNWYIRAISDEGRKIGSDENDECKIDSLAQSFAVLARLSEERRNTAVKSAFDILVDRQSETAALFTPAFSEKSSDVGYIAAYPKGIRENGGQYTHGAVWLAIALFEAGMNSEAYEVMKCINPAEKYENNLIAERYKTEPYYVCADIYCNPECVGRGGWSVYTGAAGWYYRAIFEWLLGIKINADRISFLPKIPLEWTGFSADIIYKKTAVSLSVERGNDCSLYDNGKKVENILLDGEEHTVKLIINQ